MTLKEITGDIVDAAVKLHKKLGPGLLESVYETILAAELRRRGHTAKCQQDISFDYEGMHFEKCFRLDMLVDDAVVLELKSTEKMSPVYAKQLKTYLVLMDKTVGLVLNFGMNTMTEGIVRMVNNYAEDNRAEPQSRRAGAWHAELNESAPGAEPQINASTPRHGSNNLCGSASQRDASSLNLCGSAALREEN